MKHILSLCLVLLAFSGIHAQNTIKLSIKKNEDKAPLIGATAIIVSLNKTTIADNTVLVRSMTSLKAATL